MTKKTKEWIKARTKLILEAVAEGRIEIIEGVVWGICEDCGRWKPLTPDHVLKRSLGGSHDKSNIDWVCNSYPDFCHDKRDNQGDPMKKKPKSKKAGWEKSHRCKCGRVISMLVCPYCGDMSLGIKEK